MRKSFVALLLLVGAAAALASTAFARTEEIGSGDDASAKLINAQMLREMRSAAVRTGVSGPGNTTYVGFVPTKVTATNYWGIGKGNFRVYSSTIADYGYWGWDNDGIHNNIAEVHGDSLFGWWPYRNLYTSTGGVTLPDDQRAWWALDYGNTVNYIINQGPGLKRTFGVLGVWHRDNGSASGGGVSWSALGGTHSLWCGLRAEGDLSFSDPITGNPFNARIAANSGVAGGTTGGGTGTNQLFPGYMSQWDQMAYRDVNVVGVSNVTVRFKFRTNMSTAYGTATGTRTGWFDKDPVATVAGNFISSSAAGLGAPIDSFMVYVGGPVGYAAGSSYVASDGNPYTVFDAQRRWLSETIRVNEAVSDYYEVFTTYGDNAYVSPTTSLTAPVDADWGGKARIVFRTKTNRGFDDEGGSVVGAYSSGGAGAVVIDDVEVDLGSGFVSLGDFEAAGDIDNDTGVDPMDAWKTTGKPMAVFDHAHSADDLVYEDLCGPVGGALRICNLTGNVISSGDHDNSEAAGGTFGTADQERFNGMFSPTVNLLNGGSGLPNEMDIDDDIATVTEDFYIEYDIYTGVFDFVNQGNAWRFAWSAWPGTQVNNVQTWSDWRFPGFILFNPDKQCFQDQEGSVQFGLLRWKTAGAGAAVNGANYPDSIRMYFGKVQQCFRFGITTGCSATDGCYWDNVTLAFIDGAVPPFTIDIWQLYNDTFTVNGGTNRSNVLAGSSDFDTTSALVKIGLNVAQTTTSTLRFNVPGDTVTIQAEGADTEIDLVFRVNPGPGNYSTVGNKATSLRLVPTSAAAANIGAPQTSPANFWEQYLIANGANGTVAGHPAGAVNGGKTWSPLVWNSARCDSAEGNLWVILSRGIGLPVNGLWSTMYHESDPKFTVLGIAKNRCFVKKATDGATFANITCDLVGNPTDGWDVAAGLVPENGLPYGQTYEYTKILPDGQFTPGTHVQYFFRRQDNDLGGLCPSGCLAPDTTTVFPQASEGSTDAHRWQQFGVLPDAWKKIPYGGLGQACMLYVDLNDRRGNERVWVSIADSINATSATKYGAHNGWHAPGTGTPAVNATSSFVYNLNEQPGTTWDMFGVKASESLNSKAGTIGSWNSNHAASAVDFKWSYLGPSIGMLEAYYKVLLILSGDLNSNILGPGTDFSSNDVVMLQDFMNGATSGDPRGVFVEGDGFVEAAPSGVQLGLMTNYFKVSLRDPSYLLLTTNSDACVDLVMSAPISSTDIYGVRNGCLFTDDVLVVEAGGAQSAAYSPRGVATAPVVASVHHAIDAGASEFWLSLVDGWDIENLRSRHCDASQGRLFYFANAFTNVFSAICDIAGTGGIVTEVPNNNNGRVFVDFMNLRNNPLVAGMATVELGISKSDLVEVKVFDVSGRLVRTLANRQFAPGKYTLTWDGVDNSGRQVARGVYFTQVKYVNSKFTDAKKLTVLK